MVIFESAEASRSNRDASASSIVLECQGVSFRYGRRRLPVLRSVTWSIAAGERVALLGPNGAGKSTLMKVMAGAMEPTDGSVRVGGAPADRRVRSRSVARMPQHATAIPRLTARDQVVYAGWLGGLPADVARGRAAAALSAVGLSDVEGTPARVLSGGQIRRLSLAEALARQTPLLVLDEPTAGLDPDQRMRFRKVLQDVGAALIVSTHETHDIADLFDRLTVLVNGTILFDGPTRELLELTGAETVELAYSFLVGGVDR